MNNIKTIGLKCALIDVIVKEGNGYLIAPNDKFDKYIYVLSKGNLEFVLDFTNRNIKVSHENIKIFDNINLIENNSDDVDFDYVIRFYINYINSKTETMENFIVECYENKIINENDMLNLMLFLCVSYENFDIYDINLCNKIINDSNIKLIVELIREDDEIKFKFHKSL